MIKNMSNCVVLALILCLCVGIFLPVVTAKDAFAPSWLKEGTYAKYDSNTGIIGFFNITDPKFAGTNYMLNQKVKPLTTISSSFMWRCVSVNETMAKLQVTLDYVGEPLSNNGSDSEEVSGSSDNVTFQRTGEVYVDLYTRGVYNVNGMYLGTTHLWLPANPDNDQEVTIWEEGSKTITSQVTISDYWITTVQGKQDAFRIKETRVKDQYQLGNPFYDLDTGLCVGGALGWDPIFAVVGISNGVVSTSVSETNTNLGPERSEMNWYQSLQYAIIPIAVILLVAALIIKRKKKKS